VLLRPTALPTGQNDPLFERPDLTQDDYYRLRHPSRLTAARPLCSAESRRWSPAELRDVARLARLSLSQEPGRFTRQDGLAVYVIASRPDEFACRQHTPADGPVIDFRYGRLTQRGARAGGR
jgi:hypothetical protein